MKEKKEKKVAPIKPEKIENQPIQDEVQKSYLDYAMSVIVSRALPDVRDGLKPVQRRILYAMWQMGLRANTKHKKSATVVGEVLGKYHPHGDSAVYDTMVRMAQDFSLRYPLVNGQGNFGSVDGDGAAAYRYCITSDSLIVTNRCLEKIGEISNREDISLNVLSFGGKINLASKWFNSGIHPVFKIKTFRGYELEGTANHPILTFQKGSQGKPIFGWKLIKDLKKGDFAVIDRSEVLWPREEPSLEKFFPKIEKDRFSHPIIYKLPSKMSPDLGFLMGALIAEGYLSKNKTNRNYKIGFCNTERRFINEFKIRFKRVFPDCKIYEQKRDPLSYGKKKFVSLEICSFQVVRFFENLGLTNAPSKKKKVPEIIFHSTQKTAGEFLKGYFEGDGGLSGCVRSPWVNCSSFSRDLVKEIQIILLRFGIVSFLRFDSKRGEFKLIINGFSNLVRFKEKINFLTPKKINILKKFSQLNSEERVMSKTDFVPFLAEYLKEKYRKKKIKREKKRWFLKHNLNRYPKLQKYFSYLKEILEKSDLELVKNFLANYYLFDPIISLQKNGQKGVYSLRVNSPCHSFVSNGFISHNTETRLSTLAQELLFDLEKDTVDWTANYDGTTEEPIILPGKVPNLLINGAAGIAVGVATNIPPHNLNEVCDACSYLIDHPKAEISELIKFIQGPDFPTGGIIYSVDSLEDSYSFGKGKIIIRAKTEIIDEESNNPQIIITEIPYMVQKGMLLEKIAELVQEKKIQEIKNIRDLSNKEGIKIIVDLKKGTSAEKALNRLFHASPLEISYHFNFLALVDGLQVKSLSLKSMLEYYLEHRKIVIRRRTEWELNKVKRRIHILEGFEIALLNIDRVIKIIKESKDKETAKVNLMKSFKLSEEQTLAILELRLWQLSRLESQKIKDELKELKLRKKMLEEILADTKKILNVIKEELKEIKDKYSQPRKTKIIKSALQEFKEEDLIHEQPTIVTITNEGYIKRVLPDQFRVQERGGKGTIVVKAKEGDILSHLIFTSTISELLFFTDQGKLFKMKTYDISEKSKNSKGDALVNFLSLANDEKVSAVLPKMPKNYFSLTGFKEEVEQKFLLLVTKKGIIKRVKIEEFEKARKNGLIVINLDRDDRLVGVKPSTGEDEIFLITRQGHGIRFKEKEARYLSRGAKGIKGMRLAKDDEVIALETISKKKSPQAKIFTITEHGYGKASLLTSFRLQKRAGSGTKIHRVSDKTGQITHTFFVDEKNLPEETKGDLIIASSEGQLLRIEFKDVPSLGRVSQGVRLIRFKDKNDKVSSVALI